MKLFFQRLVVSSLFLAAIAFASGAITITGAGITSPLTLAQFISNVGSGSNGFACTTNGCRIDFGAGASDYASSDGTTVTFAGPIAVTGQSTFNSTMVLPSGVAFASGGHGTIYGTAPSISSGFGSSPSIVASAGSLAFQVNVGTGGAATSGVIGLPTTADGWTCICVDITTNNTTVSQTKQTASSTTSCTVGNFTDVSVAGAWASGDKLNCIAAGY